MQYCTCQTDQGACSWASRQACPCNTCLWSSLIPWERDKWDFGPLDPALQKLIPVSSGTGYYDGCTFSYFSPFAPQGSRSLRQVPQVLNNSGRMPQEPGCCVKLSHSYVPAFTGCTGSFSTASAWQTEQHLLTEWNNYRNCPLSFIPCPAIIITDISVVTQAEFQSSFTYITSLDCCKNPLENHHCLSYSTKEESETLESMKWLAQMNKASEW